MKKYEVKALIDNLETPTLLVAARDEWQARTVYMAISELKLEGQFVDWSIKRV